MIVILNACLRRQAVKNLTRMRAHIRVRSLALLGMTVLLFTSLLIAPVSAADTGEAAIRERLKGVAETGATFAPNPSIPRYAGKIVQGGLAISGLLFFALTIYGGIMYLTSGGNEEQAKKSTKIIVRAVIGLFIIIFAGAITQFITGYLARPVSTSSAEGPEYLDRDVGEDCPAGYAQVIDIPVLWLGDIPEGSAQQGVSWAACRRL